MRTGVSAKRNRGTQPMSGALKNDHPAFVGTLEFEIVFELFGQRQLRKMRANYEFTPDGEYYDLEAHEVVLGHGRSAIGLSILAVPGDEDELYEDLDGASDGTSRSERPPRWITFTGFEEGVLNHKIWDSIYEAVAAQCKAENDARMIAAGLKPSTWG